jgi:hypothetical protein
MTGRAGASLQSRALGALVFGLALAAVLGTTLFIVQASRTTPPPRERKFRDAERELLYRVRAGRSPRLVLHRNERVVYLVTHAVLPRAAAGDRGVPYGLRVRVRQPGGAVRFAQELWSRTRRSRARFEEGVWLDENAFTADGTILGDDRVIEVRMPEGVAEGAVMDFAPVGGATEVLLRAYRRERLTEATSDVRRLALSPRERQRLASTQGVPRWEALPERERDTYVASAWQRLAAEGEDGVDYDTQAIFYTGFRAREARVAEAPGVRVDPLHAAAWNVLGPALLVLRSEGAPLNFSALDETGRVVAVGGGRPQTGPARETRVAIDEGAHTITARAPEGTAHVTLVSETSDARVHFLPGPHPPPVAGVRTIAPDLRHVPLYEASADRDHEPLCFAVDGDGDLPARALRVEVRTALCAPPHAPAEATVRYTFEGSGGEMRIETAVPITAMRAEFEEARTGEGASCPVTEPVALQLVAPVGASRFCVVGARDALFRVSTWLGERFELEPPYREHAGEAVTWRYAPPSLRRWVPLRAQRHEELAAARRLASLTAQCRLEPRGGGEGARPATQGEADPPLVLTELQPFGRARRDRVLEPVDDGASREAEGVYTPLEAAPITVRVPPGTMDTRLWFWTNAPGAPLRVVADGRTLYDSALRVQSGSLSLGALPAGVHALSATVPPGARVFVALPPARPDVQAFASRTVFPLSRTTPLEVHPPVGARSVWLVVYGTGSEAPPGVSVRAVLDGGEPVRREGVPVARLTPAETLLPLPPSARPPALFPDRLGEVVGRARTLRFRLGRDLAEVGHILSFTIAGESSLRLFARVLVEGGDGVPESALVVTRHAGGGDDG